MRPVILASTSPYRRTLFDRLGLPYRALAPAFEEVPVPGLDPQQTVTHFAQMKALSLSEQHPDAIIVGSDQGLIAHGKLWGKPGTFEAACAQLAALGGGEHELFTAVSVLDAASGQSALAIQRCLLAYRKLSTAEIADYVERDRPLDCAGSFKIESLGIAIFERVESDDPTGIMGLPLIRVRQLLARFGCQVLAPETSSQPGGTS